MKMFKCPPRALAALCLSCFAPLLPLKSAPLEGWQLVWSDEFEGEGLPNSQWWDYEVGYLRNNELQYYTAKRLENCRKENGHLIIEARNDHYQGNAVTSASLTSQRAASWTYGRIEARAQLAAGRGTWPAIWMLGDNIGEVGWPHCGEIDIMEFVGYDPDTVHGTVHTTSYNHIQNTARGGSIDYDDLTQAMHTYAVEWEPEEIRFYVDDVLYYTFTNDGQGNDATWPFHRPQHLKLNLAIGGDWGGAFGVDPSLYPTQFLIDYVRVYQRPESPPYTVDLTARGPGSLRIEPQKDYYDAGEIVTLIADPDVGMRLGKWKNAQVARSLKTELQVDRSSQIEADFVDPTSLIQNPAFDAGFDGWYNYVDSTAAATLAVNAEGQTTITVTDTGTADWHVQFGQGGFALENGNRYELTFEAQSLSGAPKLIAALSQNGAPYATFQAEPVALASALQTYTLAFTHSQASEANARVEFRLGTQLGAVAIDKVRLVNLDQNALSPYELWKRDHNIRPIDDAANPDRDLLPNLLEYLRQTDPFSPESHAPIAAVSINNGQATTSLNLDLEGHEEEISLTRQHSADLTHWEDVEEVTLPFSRIKISANPPIQD